MLKYTLKRLVLFVITLVIIISITFFLMKMLPFYPPIDPKADPEAYKIFQQRYGYDKPALYQYWLWLRNILFSWDWGKSTVLKPGVPTFQLISIYFPVTIRLNIFAILFSLPLGFIFGIWAALKKNKFTDQVISFLVMLFISIPSFVLITLLVFYPAYSWGWFPISFPPSDAPLHIVIKGSVIPVLALSFGVIASFTRQIRAELSDVLSSDYLLLARTKGLTKTQSVIRHALRNTMVVIAPMIIGVFVGILFGSLAIEIIYSVPGSAGLLLNSINQKDYNVVLTTLTFYQTISLLVGLLVDLTYSLVDPRMRIGGKKA